MALRCQEREDSELFATLKCVFKGEKYSRQRYGYATQKYPDCTGRIAIKLQQVLCNMSIITLFNYGIHSLAEEA